MAASYAAAALPAHGSPPSASAIGASAVVRPLCGHGHPASDCASQPTTEVHAMPGTEPLLQCRDLRKRYGERTAVDGVSFSIAAGETYGLLGPNGAGKTTTISMICGLLRRDGGEVIVDGRPIDIGATDAKAAIGYVPQDLAIYPDLTARENLRFFGRLQRLGGRELDAARRRDAGPDRPGRPRQGPRGQLLGRHEAPAQHRHRAAPPAGAAGARRADGRRRPAEPQRHPLERRRPRAPGDGHPLHDPLHGGGGAPLRPHRDHRRGAHPGRGHAPRAGRPGRPEGPGRARRQRRRRTGGRRARARSTSSRRRRPGTAASSSSSTRRGTTCRASSRPPPTTGPACAASRSSSPTSRRSSCT